MMSRYLAYAGSAVGTFLGKAWDCGKWCAVGNCNMNAIECVHSPAAPAAAKVRVRDASSS